MAKRKRVRSVACGRRKKRVVRRHRRMRGGFDAEAAGTIAKVAVPAIAGAWLANKLNNWQNKRRRQQLIEAWD